MEASNSLAPMQSARVTVYQLKGVSKNEARHREFWTSVLCLAPQHILAVLMCQVQQLYAFPVVRRQISFWPFLTESIGTFNLSTNWAPMPLKFLLYYRLVTTHCSSFNDLSGQVPLVFDDNLTRSSSHIYRQMILHSRTPSLKLVLTSTGRILTPLCIVSSSQQGYLAELFINMTWTG